jgi:hypothetical protein
VAEYDYKYAVAVPSLALCKAGKPYKEISLQARRAPAASYVLYMYVRTYNSNVFAKSPSKNTYLLIFNQGN